MNSEMTTPTITLVAEEASVIKPPARTSFYRPELDVLRFFAFLAVFMVHTTSYPLDYFVQRHVPRWAAEILVSIAYAGSYGVDLFFVLSAYLITELLVREKEERGALDVKSFYIRRILRIWPLYYFFVPLAAIIPFCNPQHAFGLRFVVPFLCLAGNWSLVAFGWPESVAIPLWSVSVEEQFYLLWPPIVARLSRRGIIRAAVVMIVLANLARFCVLLLHGSAPQLWGNTFAHLDSMAAGILLAVLLSGRAPGIGHWMRAGLVVCALLGLAARAHFVEILPRDAIGWGETLLGWPVVAASCTAMVVASIGLNVQVRPLRYLGKISYGLYVYHLLCIKIVEKLLCNESGFWHMALRFVLSLGITILISSASYAILEKPFLNLKRKFTYVSSRPV
jgi:peptidoglycan/LPS O-acetylase OafA/YrhL